MKKLHKYYREAAAVAVVAAAVADRVAVMMIAAMIRAVPNIRMEVVAVAVNCLF